MIEHTAGPYAVNRSGQRQRWPHDEGRTMNRSCWLVVVMIVSLLMSGCGGGDSNESSSDLAGTSWRLQEWSASSSNPRDFTITAQFDDTMMSGRSAVNSYGGEYTATTDGNFSLGPLVQTEMAGSPAAMQAESIYFSLLQSVRKYKVAGTTLTLYDANWNAQLIYSRTTD
jgi:heat shock protein HslJ